MAKSHRGLPSDFTLDIPDRPKPVDLGDYLDEVDAAPRPTPKPKSEAQPPQPAPSPAPSDRKSDRGNVVEMRRSASEAPAEQDEEPEEPKARPKKRRTPKPPPRRQINMSPETQRMVDELIVFVQEYGPQKDAKGSEVFHGLVLALYESLDQVDLSNVPPRGRWGTPTAQSFPISLKSAFKAAIAESYHRKK